MASGARSVYVYYRVAPADLGPALAAARAMQAELCVCHPGLQAQVLRRVEVASATMGATGAGLSAVTLMEVYAAPQGVDDALLAAIESAAASQPAMRPASARHVERFEPCG